MDKAKNLPLTLEFLDSRAQRSISAGYTKQKWITFCETLIRAGYSVSLYEAKETYSKYITITKGDKRFLVRFSNHKPNATREKYNDCDFFVGVNNLSTTTTSDALLAVMAYFAG